MDRGRFSDGGTVDFSLPGGKTLVSLPDTGPFVDFLRTYAFCDVESPLLYARPNALVRQRDCVFNNHNRFYDRPSLEDYRFGFLVIRGIFNHQSDGFDP